MVSRPRLVTTLFSSMFLLHAKIFLLQNQLNMSVSRVISTYVYEVGIESQQHSYSAAVGLFNNVVGVIMVVSAWVVKLVIPEDKLKAEADANWPVAKPQARELPPRFVSLSSGLYAS